VTILVVEDEPYVAELLQETLEGEGNRCVVASDASGADRALATSPVEAITLDLSIPGRDGLAWLETLAATRPDLARHTLVVTGSALGRVERDRVAAVGARILAKPFRIEQLLDRLREVLPPEPEPRN
jgi:two-component system OmpR family response regulator